MRHRYGGATPQLALDIAPPHNSDEAMARASRGLPDDEPGLIAAAHQAVRSFASTMDHAPDDQESRRRTESRIEAIVHKLAGPNDRWSEEAEQAKDRLEASLRVDDGSVPIWGQPGRFVVTAAGCRVIVKVDGILGNGLNHIECYALDFDRPFITQTGYRSMYPNAPSAEPMSVDAWATKAILDSLQEYRGYGRPTRTKNLVPITMESRAAAPLGYDDDEAPILDPAWQPGGWLHELAKNPPPVNRPKPQLRKRSTVKPVGFLGQKAKRGAWR